MVSNNNSEKDPRQTQPAILQGAKTNINWSNSRSSSTSRDALMDNCHSVDNDIIWDSSLVAMCCAANIYDVVKNSQDEAKTCHSLELSGLKISFLTHC